MKESVQKFDLEAAFKALEEVEIPVVKGIRPNRENLQEKFTKKLTSEILVEDYFDVNDTNALEQASEEREAEIAKAKLARIEKIVDLNAETEEDLLPSYVGKLIIQCPQCMTLFYKKEEDIEKSDENPDVVNLNEPCQHCGNSSGYTLIGKVDQVGEEEAENYDVEDFDENELDLDFGEESVEEEEVEEPTEEAATEEEEELDLEPIEEEEPEEEVKESLTEAADDVSEDEEVEIVDEESVEEILTSVEEVKEIAAEAGDEIAEVTKENPEIESEEIKEITDEVVEAALEVEEEEEVSEEDVKESLTEDVEINKQMELYNEFVKYLQKMVEQDEDALEEAKKLGNKEVIAAIEKRLENSKAELKAALPTTVKDEVIADDLPTPEEAEMEAPAENKDEKAEEKATEKKESLKEYYDEEAPLGRDRPYGGYYGDNRGDWSKMMSKAPQWWIDQGGTDASWADRPMRKGKHNEETGRHEYYDESLTEELRTWICWYEGHDIGTVEAETEEEAAEEMMIKYPEYQYNNTDWGVSLEGEDLDEAAPQAASQLKRKLSTTEIMVKELKEHPLFNRLSTRTIQRVLLPYYIEQMGRENLSAEAMIDFFEFEGFATYVLDHFMEMDPLARKELLKADAKFMEIFNAYAAEYKLFPGNAEELEPGESEFDYIYNVIFDIDAEGNVVDSEATRDTVKSFGKMVAAGKFDKSLVEELKEDVAGDLDTLLDSEEFKKPISEKEVEAIAAKYEALEEEIMPGIESEIAMKHIVDTWEAVEDLDDKSFNKLTENYLTEVYSNVKSFEATGCDLKEGKLIVEGDITFNSGKIKPTTFVYEAKDFAENKVVLEGLNADFATEKAFVLNCNINSANCLIVESLGYKYSINETLVEGLLK